MKCLGLCALILVGLLARPSWAEDPAELLAGCKIQDAGNCHNLDGVNYTAISDLAALPGGFVHADDIVLASPQVNQACVWGAYFDGVNGPDDTHSCADEVLDKFRVRFYADDGGGKPDHTDILYDSWAANGGDPDDVRNTGWLTEANGGVVKSETTDQTSTPNNPLNLHVYTLAFPTATLPTGETIWLEVVNNTDTPTGSPLPVRNTCHWWWAQSQNIFETSTGTGNEWSYTGTEYRPVFLNPSPFSSRAGQTGYQELGHDWTDQTFCLAGPGGPANFSDPAAPTGCCCSCDGTTDSSFTLAECTSQDINHERRWARNSDCPDSCLAFEFPGDDCGSFSGSATAAATSPVFLEDGALLFSTVCATDSLMDSFPGNDFLGGDFFAHYTATCTGEMVISMCNTGIFYGNYDSFMAVYHDFDNPADCPCPSSALDFNVAHSDEDCNGESDAGAGVIDGLAVFPGECWLVRIGGWGSGPGAAAHGFARLDTACILFDDCAPGGPPTLQTQFGGSNASEPKSRFLAIKSGTPFVKETIRVTWDQMPNWPGGHTALVGQKKYITQPFQVCENSGQGLATSPPDCGPAPGQPQRWFWAAELTCDAGQAWFGDLTALESYCTGSGEVCTADADCAQGTCGVDGVIHLVDPGIVPSRNTAGNPQSATYSVRTTTDRCPLNQDFSFSSPLTTETAGWGDVGNALACPFGPPNGSTDMIPDVTEAIRKFSNDPCAPKKTRVDMDQDFQIGFPTDVLMILNAFSSGGAGFTEPAPAACSTSL